LTGVKSEGRDKSTGALFKQYHQVSMPMSKKFWKDGRKDKTLVYKDLDGKKHRRLIVEEHISLVQEPGFKYFGHVTPERGTSLSIKESIINFIENSDI